jgi:hypothetical protein
LRAGQEATLRLEADLPGEWHVYSVDAGDEYVFKPASLRLLPAAQGIELVGPLTASAPTHTEHDEVLEGKVVYFTHRAAFTQRIKVTKNNPVLRCVLGYQACEYKEFNTCIFPEIEMEIRPRAAR